MSGAARVVCTPRVKRVQTISLSLIFIICVVNYMDRGTLSVANPLIRNELGLSVAEMGVLLSAFLWPYAFSLLFAGGLVDRLKPRRVLTISMIVWSIAQGLAGFVVSYVQFLMVRALLGVGEAPMFPTASRVVSDWYHESDQALGVGIWNGAPPLGNAVAPLLLTPVMLVFGWRWMFVLMAVLGFILAGIWYVVYRDFDSETLTEMDRRYLYHEGVVPEAHPVHAAAWGKLFSFRSYLGADPWLFRQRLYRLAVRRVVAGLPGTTTPYEHLEDRICRRGAVPVRPGRQHRGRILRRPVDHARYDSDCQPQDADRDRFGDHGMRHLLGGRDGQQLRRRRVDFGGHLLRPELVRHVLVTRHCLRAAELCGFAGGDHGFRRLHWRCAGADGHRLHGAGHGIIHPGATGRRCDRPLFGRGLWCSHS